MTPLELRADYLVDVEEAVLLEADLDERGLHPGQDVVDAAEVDVAGNRAALRPLEVDLGGLAVLEDGDAALADVDGDEQFALRCGKRRAALRLPAAAGRLVAAALLPLGELPPLRLLRGSAFSFARSGAAAPAVEPGFLRPRPPRLPRRRFGLVGSVGSEPAASAAGSVSLG